MTLGTSLQSGWGDLRAWLGQDTLDGAKVHTLFERWPNKAELKEAVLPYCLDQLRRQGRGVEPRRSVPYSGWFDGLLQEAMALDEALAHGQAIRAYRDCLCLKPNCLPAALNMHRLRHRGHGFGQLLEQGWEAFGPYGDESWMRLEKGLREMEGEDPEQVDTILENLTFDIEHQLTLYPSTLALAAFLIHGLDHEREDRGHVAASMRRLAHMVLYTMVPPYTAQDLAEGTLWPVAKCWSFVDPYIVSLGQGQRTTVDEAALWFEHRQYAVWHQASWEGYNTWESCKIPCFAQAPFIQGKRNLIYDNISASIFQVIASGLPVYRRLARETPGQRFTDQVLWHVGHFARQEQEVIRQRVEPASLRMFSKRYVYESA